jgi:hypothetical protein
MTSFDDMYGSKYLSVPDLKGGTLRVKIGKVEPADLREKDGTTKKKLVLFFNGRDKGLVLNKTNALVLADAFGKNLDDWVDQRLDIYSEMTGLGCHSAWKIDGGRIASRGMLLDKFSR